MTAFDLAVDCGIKSKSLAKRLALRDCPRLRRFPYSEITPEETELLRTVFISEINRVRIDACGPNLPGLTPDLSKNPSVYLFDKWRVRVVIQAGKPWFIARDVTEALEYTRFDSNLLAHVPEHWKGTNPIRTPGGDQQLATLSLEGLFYFLNRSDKPAARPFQEWVNGTVLVSIHRTGSYSAPGSDPKPPAKPVPSRLPSGAQLHEIRLMAERRLISAEQVQDILGVRRAPAAAPRPEEPKAPPAIAAAGFEALASVAAGGIPAGVAR